MPSHFLPVEQEFPQAIQDVKKGSRTLSLGHFKETILYYIVFLWLNAKVLKNRVTCEKYHTSVLHYQMRIYIERITVDLAINYAVILVEMIFTTTSLPFAKGVG